MLIFISIAAFIATLIGGIFAIYLKDNRHLILGFSAGAVIGVAFFDLLPEALELAGKDFSTSNITGVVALGFILYMLLDRLIGFHSHTEDKLDQTHLHHHEYGHEDKLIVKNNKGRLGAGSLSFHSFLDGVGVGLAFQVSTSVGIVVTTAVLVHDFSDGINTVNLILRSKGSVKQAFKWLLFDAVAPVLGIISTLFFTLNESILGLMLAMFCGFFLYIGASDLLPESNHNHPTIFTTVMTVLGFAVIYTAITLAGI